jgi:hypothetical protein
MILIQVGPYIHRRYPAGCRMCMYELGMLLGRAGRGGMWAWANGVGHSPGLPIVWVVASIGRGAPRNVHTPWVLGKQALVRALAWGPVGLRGCRSNGRSVHQPASTWFPTSRQGSRAGSRRRAAVPTLRLQLLALALALVCSGSWRVCVCVCAWSGRSHEEGRRGGATGGRRSALLLAASAAEGNTYMILPAHKRWDERGD